MKTRLLKKVRKRCSITKIISCGDEDSWENAFYRKKASACGGFPYYEINTFGDSAHSKEYEDALEYVAIAIRKRYGKSKTITKKVWWVNKEK